MYTLSETPPFWPQFWPALFATVIGVFVGFWLALRTDHARERKARDQREAGLLKIARNAVAANLTLIDQLDQILAGTPPQLPSFDMDVVLLDVVCPRLVEISENADLIAQLNNFRFQLHHVNRKLDRLLDLGLLPPGASVVPAPPVRTALATMAAGIRTATLAPLAKAGQALLPLLHARITLLETHWPVVVVLGRVVTAHPSASGLASQDWTPATSADVWLSFLRAEWDNASAFTSGHDRTLIDNPDLTNADENRLRRTLLYSWRWPLLQPLPADTRW